MVLGIKQYESGMYLALAENSTKEFNYHFHTECLKSNQMLMLDAVDFH